MSFSDDVLKLENDAASMASALQGFVAAIEAGNVTLAINDAGPVVTTAMAVVADLEAVGVDAAGFFKAHVHGHLYAMPSKLGAVNWGNLLSLLLQYGPAIYNLLAQLLHWPPLPFPIPSPVSGT